MTAHPLPGWQDNAKDAAFSEPVDCARRITRFERTILVRNVVEYVAGALVTVLFGGTALAALSKGEALLAIASLAIVAGVWVALWGLRQRASNLARRPEDACLTHLRRQYQHQQAALAAVPRWYIGPMVPGVVLFCVAIVAGVAEQVGWSRAIQGTLPYFAIVFAVFAAVAGANWFGARALTRKIDELDALA
ncbi:MAG: hypothetical protein ACX930_01555 [Erythrobacter sp.]